MNLKSIILNAQQVKFTEELRINYPRFNNLITSKLELAQHSKSVQVIICEKSQIRNSSYERNSKRKKVF